jgi:hypothetical protein
MANRNFQNKSFSMTHAVVSLYGSFAVGPAGAVVTPVGNGLSIALTATGRYTITLEDRYNRFLGASIGLVCDIDGTAKTAITGRAATQTATYAAKSATTAGDHIVLTDTNGALWGFALDVAGTDPEPTSAIWASIPAGRKVNIDISGATLGAQVAALVETAVDALTGFTALVVTTVTSDAIAFAHVYRKPVAAMQTFNADGSAAGSTTVAESVLGLQTTVNVTDNTVSIPAHGFQTGKAIALAIGGGSLPAGLSATTYYLIATSADLVKFATSLANAEAGTAVDITDYGTAANTMTLTPSISGSGIFKSEVSTGTVQTVIQTATPAIEIALYNASGVLTQPANGTQVYFELKLRNSGLKMKGE